MRSLLLLLGLCLIFMGCEKEEEAAVQPPAGMVLSGTASPSPSPAVSLVPSLMPTPSQTVTPSQTTAPTSAVSTDTGDLQLISRQEAGLSEVPYKDREAFHINQRLMELLEHPEGYADKDFQSGIVKANGSYILEERYKSSIAGVIRIGNKKDDVIQALGQPSFELEDLIYYKTESFYLAFGGKDTVELAALAPAPQSDAPADLLKQVDASLNTAPNVNLEEVLRTPVTWQELFTNQGRINPGGWYARSDAGIEITDFYEDSTIEVYNNYTDKLYQRSESVKYPIKFTNEDSIGRKMYGNVWQHRYTDDRFAKEGKLSPSGSRSSIYEWVYSMLQYFVIRSTDVSTPDFQVHALVDQYEWLTDHYILFTDFYEQRPMILPVDQEDPDTINLLQTLGIDDTKDSAYTIEEVKDGIIKLKGMKDSTTLSIHFQEDEKQQIQFTVD